MRRARRRATPANSAAAPATATSHAVSPVYGIRPLLAREAGTAAALAVVARGAETRAVRTRPPAAGAGPVPCALEASTSPGGDEDGAAAGVPESARDDTGSVTMTGGGP